jgi:predicted RNA-binding protein YlxR (DUF448 family)
MSELVQPSKCRDLIRVKRVYKYEDLTVIVDNHWKMRGRSALIQSSVLGHPNDYSHTLVGHKHLTISQRMSRN